MQFTGFGSSGSNSFGGSSNFNNSSSNPFGGNSSFNNLNSNPFGGSSNSLSLSNSNNSLVADAQNWPINVKQEFLTSKNFDHNKDPQQIKVDYLKCQMTRAIEAGLTYKEFVHREDLMQFDASWDAGKKLWELQRIDCGKVALGEEKYPNDNSMCELI